MTVPSSSTVSPRRVAVTDDLRERGFDIDSQGRVSVASDGPAAFAGVDAPLSVVSVPESRPMGVVSEVANAASEGRVPVLVTDTRTADEVWSVLSEPFLLAGRETGGREFYPVEDRILLSDQSYACAGTTGAFEWFESEPAADNPRLVLEVGGEPVTVLDSVDGLTCPGPAVSAFRYRYARGEDRQFRVFEGDRAVGQYSSVTAMRADGFRPVPLPLVPEHHVRDGGRFARATVLASVTDDRTVDYRSVSAEF